MDNRHQYAMLKKIAYLYYQKKEKNKPLSQIISEISDEMDLSEESIENYLIAVTNFKPKYNADFYTDDEDEEYNASAIDTVANSYTTEDWFFRLEQKEKLISTLSDLSITEQKLIESRFGICLNCLMNLPKSTMCASSMALGLTESGAEKKLKAILKKLRKALQE